MELLAHNGNQPVIPDSIPSQSDSEGTITKKRKLGLEGGDREKKASEVVAITDSLEIKESRTTLDQQYVSGHNDTNEFSAASLAEGRPGCRSVDLSLEDGTDLKLDDVAREGGNHGMLGTEALSSTKVSRASEEPLRSDSKIVVGESGQILQIEQAQPAYPSGVGNEKESDVMPTPDSTIGTRPTRKKRKFVGNVQKFAKELEQECPATLADMVSDGVEQLKASPKISRTRGRTKKALATLGQESIGGGNLSRSKPKRVKSAVETSPIEGRLGKPQPRRRGRPKKVVPQGGDLKGVDRNVRLNESDLEAQPSQNAGCLRNSPPEPGKGQEKVLSFAGEIIDLQEVCHRPKHDEIEYDADIANKPGTSPRETRDHTQQMLPVLGDATDPSSIVHNGIHSESEIVPHILPPFQNLSTETQGESQTVSSLPGQICDLPGILCREKLSDSGLNAQTPNSLKDSSWRTRQEPQKITPPQGEVGDPQSTPSEGKLKKFLLPVGKETGQDEAIKLGEMVQGKQLPLPKRQTIKLPSRRKRRLKLLKSPALEGIDTEDGFQRRAVLNNESSIEFLWNEGSSKIQLPQKRLRSGTQSRASKKGEPNDAEPIPPKQNGLQTQAPVKKKRKPKKHMISDGLSSKREEAFSRSTNAPQVSVSTKEGYHFPSLQPSKNPTPISVYRLSCDKADDAVAAGVVSFRHKFLNAVDVLAQVCREFTLKSKEPLDDATQSSPNNTLNAEMNREFEIIEDFGENFDSRLVELVCQF